MALVNERLLSGEEEPVVVVQQEDVAMGEGRRTSATPALCRAHHAAS
jgi:hypothetical protein